jgi:hypothetical protein
MKHALTIAVAALLVTFAPTSPSLSAAPLTGGISAGAVKVTVHYKGKGKVDASHKLWVFLFDTPNIGPGSMPIDMLSLENNDSDAVFAAVSPDKVWVAVAYDETGGMTGDAPPPSGTPITIFSAAGGAPMAVISGAKDAAVVTFDDSQRMP